MLPTASTEAAALEAALSALLTSTTTGAARAREARALSRAADDLEVAAAECSDASVRHALMEQVDAARATAAEARLQARASAQAIRRDELLGDARPSRAESEDDSSQAAGLAREINEGLRRATAVVAEEVDRSQASGKIVEASSRRLRMTRDQHSRYGEALGSGASTLSELKRSELIANIAVVASFALFFFIAASVAHRRLSSSNTATLLVRPAAKIVFAPVRLVTKMLRFLLEKREIEPLKGHSDHSDQNRADNEAKRKSRKRQKRISTGTQDQWKDNDIHQEDSVKRLPSEDKDKSESDGKEDVGQWATSALTFGADKQSGATEANRSTVEDHEQHDTESPKKALERSEWDESDKSEPVVHEGL